MRGGGGDFGNVAVKVKVRESRVANARSLPTDLQKKKKERKKSSRREIGCLRRAGQSISRELEGPDNGGGQIGSGGLVSDTALPVVFPRALTGGDFVEGSEAGRRNRPGLVIGFVIDIAARSSEGHDEREREGGT
ncbi:hypothetical protein AXG93_3903s1040 [Marchantia polymorpha subsp. ruderalis]|uniref:Uncharacterized protein n=1 Tax=Marchantia polymorpha subsp. ruderalis TaxID=1480154 RepID=A0A176VQC1_MARPO|nr:hypothetical protein AXG93_3903s1040 [Marchantia polymorpha subsp. ruderalis]